MTHARGEGEPEGPPAEPGWGSRPWGQAPGGAPPPSGATQPYGQLPADFRPPGQAPPPPGTRPAGDVGSARSRNRVGLWIALALAVLTGVAGLTVLALSAGRTVLSRAAVERDVAAQFEQQEGVPVDLRCTQEMLVEEGATYTCAGVTADDEEVTLRIEITDADGARYTWSEP